MKIGSSIAIDRPITGLADMMADFTLSPQWMGDLQSCEPISGQPGVVGSKAALTFRNGKRTMMFTATLIEKNLPQTVRSTLDSPMLRIDAVARFRTISPEQTMLVFEQDFVFKGLGGKIVGYLMKSQIRKQQQAHIAGFKRFVDR